jgi:hypothetical protein
MEDRCAFPAIGRVTFQPSRAETEDIRCTLPYVLAAGLFALFATASSTATVEPIAGTSVSMNRQGQGFPTVTELTIANPGCRRTTIDNRLRRAGFSRRVGLRIGCLHSFLRVSEIASYEFSVVQSVQGAHQPPTRGGRLFVDKRTIS